MPPVHEPNQPITVENTDIVEIDGQSTHVPVNVIFRSLPFPSVIIEAHRLPLLVLGKERLQITLANGARLEVMVQSFNPGTLRGSLIPARQPVNVLDKRVPLKSLHFSILNFPELYGNQMKWRSIDGGASIAIPHTRIEASDWCVEITGVQNISDVVKTLKRQGGYGVTYNGAITRSDQADFTVEEVEVLLTALRTFLSFARGTSCSLALVEGKDQYGQQSWIRWGAHHVAPWNGQRSWFRCHSGDDILSELFPRLWRLFENGDEWKQTILRTVDWYLLSNESATHTGIILSQAALERFSHRILERGKNRAESTGKFIRSALEELNIESQIPSTCGELKSLQQTHRWEDGVHALVNIRNDLVHPTVKLGDISHYAHYDAWNLGQWYIEMMLLSKLGYQGSYVNRLATRHSETKPILPVPWAQDHDVS